MLSIHTGFDSLQRSLLLCFFFHIALAICSVDMHLLSKVQVYYITYMSFRVWSFQTQRTIFYGYEAVECRLYMRLFCKLSHREWRG